VSHDLGLLSLLLLLAEASHEPGNKRSKARRAATTQSRRSSIDRGRSGAMYVRLECEQASGAVDVLLSDVFWPRVVEEDLVEIVDGGGRKHVSRLVDVKGVCKGVGKGDGVGGSVSGSVVRVKLGEELRASVQSLISTIIVPARDGGSTVSRLVERSSMRSGAERQCGCGRCFI
jgi:hypothetical protein